LPLNLHDTQSLLSKLITSPEGAASALAALQGGEHTRAGGLVRGDARLSSLERIDVYADMYYYRIRDCIADDFPTLRAVVGAAHFHNLITDYLLQHPSSHFSLRQVGRSLPAFVLVFTLLSSWIGAGSLFAGAENAYRNGFAALWQPAGGWAGLLLIYFIAPRARKFAQYTIPDLLEARYNQTARVLGVIAILFAYTAIASYQLRGGGDILHLIFPDAISSTAAMYIVTAFVIVFTALGGMA